ncbi:MAG TPA: diaminopimelate decarboxylase, partial [Clostridia bacterium]|nr:diaminopimelate decarboxylase [Clostridia bacterium]
YVDAMSPGEIFLALKAGCKPSQILYISNNVGDDELRYAIDAGVMVSVDSLSQLDRFGRLNKGGDVVVRFNPNVGAGHHEKVITGGKSTKFGINSDRTDDVIKLLEKHNLTLLGINQHIGSLFMDGTAYIQSVKSLLSIAEKLPVTSFIDFGGGFGIPYHKQEGQNRLDIKALGKELSELLKDWANKNHPGIGFKTEPGRYVIAEGGILLGTVHSIKYNGDKKFIGTDIGFNVLVRPVMYDSYHDIEVFRGDKPLCDSKTEVVTVVGNICETGDVLAKDRELPVMREGDIIAVTDAGAYGYSMSSNYNSRLRPAEVLLTRWGEVKLIRRRDRLEDLLVNLNV